MKKLLTTASAALAGLALSASAVAGEITVSGGASYTLSVTDYAAGGVTETDGLSVYNNSEIHFTGTGVTDGGLTVTARVELEGHSQAGDQIDEHYITISGGFGSLEIGANDGADERTGKGVLYNGSAVQPAYWWQMPVPQNTGYLTVGNATDGMGLNYTTPSFGGAVLAVSYKPQAEPGSYADGTDSQNSGELEYGEQDITSVGLAYSGDMGGTSLGASLGYTTQEDDLTILGVGVEVGLGDTTLYGRWQRRDPDGDDNDTTYHTLGVSHSLGAITVGLAYTGAEREFAAVPVSGAGTVSASGANDDRIFIGSVDYSLGGGATATLYAASGKTEQTGGSGVNAAAVTDANKAATQSGSAFGVALSLAF